MDTSKMALPMPRRSTLHVGLDALRQATVNWRELAESICITVAAIVVSMLIFGVFMWLSRGVSPFALYHTMYIGSFGTSLSLQSTLERAAPLILTALCTALPARVGLIIIGGEGALVLGGLAAACTGLLLKNAPVPVNLFVMAVAGMAGGALLIAAAGLLRHFRGVNETISSLLLAYIAIGAFTYFVEGPLRDPNPISANKPSTPPISDEPLLGKIFGDVHWGLGFGVVFCLIMFVLMYRTTFGFAARMVGGNARAAQGAGLPVGRVILITCLLAGAAAGLAGMVEVAAVQRQANASLLSGYGFRGILVSFIARHHPLGIMPVAILFGGLGESSDLLQRRLDLPDASTQVLMGIMFIVILLFETLYGRFRVFMPREVREAAA
jgi:ABC-type uncharacterized transport system permease subunit